jgi:hypothetical protein
MVLHEAVAEVVDGVVIDGEEIPGLVVDQPRGRRVDADALAQCLAHEQTPVFGLIDRLRVRDEGFHHLRGEFLRVHAQLGERLFEFAAGCTAPRRNGQPLSSGPNARW